MLDKILQIKQVYDKIMADRYGKLDTLNKDLLIFWAAVVFLNLFFRNLVVGLIVPVFLLAAVFRFMSTNTVQRLSENREYSARREKTITFAKIQYKRIAEYKTHRYFKCKNCSAYIRVPAKPGKHRIECPKCGKEFDVKIKQTQLPKHQ